MKNLSEQKGTDRRRFLKYGAGVVVVAAAAAAGYYALQPAPGPPTPTTTAATTLPPTPTTTAPPPPPAPVTINAYYPAHNNWLASDAVLNPFTQKTGIKVNAIVDSFFVIHDKLASTFASGVYAYDACYAWGAWMSEFLEFFQPLDALGLEVPSDLKDDLIPWTRIAPTFKGRWYGLPNAFWVMLLHTNKKMFDEAGLEVPTSWDKFLETCEALKKKFGRDGVYPFAAGFQQGYLFPHYCAFLHGNGGSLWANDAKRTVTCDSKEAIAAVEDMITLYDNYMDPGAIEWIAGVQSGKAFYTEKAAMTLYYPWHSIVATKYYNLTTVAALWPGKKVRSGSGSAAEAMAIPKTAKYPKEAFELMKYNASADIDVGKPLAADDKYESTWPIRKSSYDDPRLANLVYPGFVQLVREQATYRCTRYERPAYQKMNDIIEAEIVNALKKVKTAEGAMKDAADLIEPIVDDEYAKYGGGYEDPWDTMPH